MINIVQSSSYTNKIVKIIENYVNDKSYDVMIEVVHTYKVSSPSKSYFVVNDVSQKDWDGIKIARRIRQQDSTADIVLISNDIDYMNLYRLHISLLGVVEMEKIDYDLFQYIDYLMENRKK